MRKILLLSMIISTNCFAITRNYVEIPYQQAKVNMQSPVFSKHEIHLINDSSEVKKYDISYQICVDQDCKSDRKTISLDPQKKFDEKKVMSFVKSFRRAYDHPIVGHTRVWGNSKVDQVDQIGYGTIKIYE